MNEWIDIGVADEIPRLGARVVRAGERQIAVFRTADDLYFALDDRCPHRGGPLSQGIVPGHKVTCPLHYFVIELGSGNAVAPDKGCVRQHGVQVEDGRVRLSLNTSKR